MNATTFAVDIAKSVMQLHWVEPSGEIRRKKLTRTKMLEFFAQRLPARVVMEACGGAHQLARELMALGHQAELLPAHQIRGFVRANKNDAADARGLWLAAQQSDIRRVPVKSVQQQAVLALHRTRSHWITMRTATINALRGLLYEFGVVLPKGKAAGLKTLRETRAGIEAKLPASMVQLIEQQLSGLREIECRLKWFELQIAAVLRDQAQARKLNQIPGVGVLGATALAAVLADASAWRNGREFAATLGLVPRHSGTGGKVRIGPVSKRGDPYLRTLLVNGARSVISHPQPPRWAVQLLARRPFNVAVVALANKMARTAWALVAHGRSYDKNWQSQPPDRLQRLPGAASEPAN